MRVAETFLPLVDHQAVSVTCFSPIVLMRLGMYSICWILQIIQEEPTRTSNTVEYGAKHDER